MRMLFKDRYQAGQALAHELSAYTARPDAVVLALPRGGVPVGYEIARALHLPLEIFVVRKIGMPGHEEVAIGAIASGGVQVLSEEIIRTYRLDPRQIERVIADERRELQRREQAYGQPALASLQGKLAILVDDGLATGASMQAAARAVRTTNPSRIVAAVPVGSREACAALRVYADDVVCASTPEPFIAVGMWYENFTQISDEEVRQILEHTAKVGS